MIDVFTPSSADADNTNAQMLTVKEIVARLDPERFRVLMLCPGVPDARLKARPNTHFVRRVPRGNTPFALLQCLNFGPDICFYPNASPLSAAFLWLKQTLHLPVSVVLHAVSGGVLEGEPPAGLLRRIRQADAIFGNNSYLSSVLEGLAGVKVRTIYNGINRRFFYLREGPREKRDGLSVLYAGSFRGYKRVDVVVREAAAHPDVQFRLAGTGEEEVACRKLAAELRCDNVHFLGHLNQQELGHEMRLADVFFFPSIMEGHPQVLGQAAACGLPSIALNRYRPDYVSNGQTGFLVNSHQEMGPKLSELLNNSELRCAMSAAAIQHAQQFDWDTIVQQWQEVFEDLVARRRK